jgi:hypothetical protein
VQLRRSIANDNGRSLRHLSQERQRRGQLSLIYSYFSGRFASRRSILHRQVPSIFVDRHDDQSNRKSIILYFDSIMYAHYATVRVRGWPEFSMSCRGRYNVNSKCTFVQFVIYILGGRWPDLWRRLHRGGPLMRSMCASRQSRTERRTPNTRARRKSIVSVTPVRRRARHARSGASTDRGGRDFGEPILSRRFNDESI